MKKKIIVTALTIIMLATIFLISGCSTALNAIMGNTTRVTAAILFSGVTLYQDGVASQYVVGEAASQELISNANPAFIKFPDGTDYDFSPVTGGLEAQNYFFGQSPTNQGSIVDPMYETQYRQLRLKQAINEPISGKYTAGIEKSRIDIDVNQSDYLPSLVPDDISTTAGENMINVTAGDTITVNNQNNAYYRYLCRIYDTRISDTAVDNYWSSTDLRVINWTNVEDLEDFFIYNLDTPSNGKVTFRVPGGILNPGQSNLLLVISAYDTRTMNSDPGEGDLSSFTYGLSEIRLYYNGI